MGTESDLKLYELWKSTPRERRIFWGTVGLASVCVSVYSLVNPNSALTNLVRIRSSAVTSMCDSTHCLCLRIAVNVF